MINTLKADYSLRLLCETLGVHRCNLYHEPRPDEDQPIKDALRELGGAWPTYGYRRLTVMLRREGLRVNEKRVRRLMHELDMCGEAPKRKPRTTDSSHPVGIGQKGHHFFGPVGTTSVVAGRIV
jgi:putative transposase